MSGEEISEPASDSPIMSPSSWPELPKSPFRWSDTPTQAMFSTSPSRWSFSPLWEFPTCPVGWGDTPTEDVFPMSPSSRPFSPPLEILSRHIKWYDTPSETQGVFLKSPSTILIPPPWEHPTPPSDHPSLRSEEMCSPNGVTSSDQRPLFPLSDLSVVNGFDSPGNANPSVVYGAQQAYSSTFRRSNQVFVSFWGEDTRKLFTSDLYLNLKYSGFYNVFDDDLIGGEENIDSLLYEATQESKISMVVVSGTYAFVRHEERFKGELGERQNEWKAKVERWREALREVSNLRWVHLQYHTHHADAVRALMDDVRERLRIQEPRATLHELTETSQAVYAPASQNDAVLAYELTETSQAVCAPESQNDAVLAYELTETSQAVCAPANQNDAVVAYELTETSQAVYDPESQNDTVLTRKQGLRKTVKRKPGMSKSTIGLDVLKQYFSMKLTDAAMRLNVSRSTLKRICRQHEISRWPSHKRYNSLNQIGSVEGPFTATPAEGPSLCLDDAVGLHQQDSQPPEPSELQEAENISPTCKTSSSDHRQPKVGDQMLGANVSIHKQLHEQTGFLPDPVKASNRYKTESTFTEKRRNSNIDNSCQGNPVGPTYLDLDSEQAMGTHSHEIPHVTSTTDGRIVTMKATYGEDMIRFRLSSRSGIVELKEEVAKRLKLEIDSFNIKYLDNEHDWILIGCEADLRDCMDLSSSPGSDTIRLQIHEIPNSKSPYKSTRLGKRTRIVVQENFMGRPISN